MKRIVYGMAVLLLLLPITRLYAQGPYYLSQIANGRFDRRSYRTTFIVFNTTDDLWFFSSSIKVTDDSGNPLPITIPDWGTKSEFSLTIWPASTILLQTDGSGELVVGAATVTAPPGVGASAIFTVYDTAGGSTSEAGVAASGLMRDCKVALDRALEPVEVGFNNLRLVLIRDRPHSQRLGLPTLLKPHLSAGTRITYPLRLTSRRDQVTSAFVVEDID
jgi:hypothetical protein